MAGFGFDALQAFPAEDMPPLARSSPGTEAPQAVAAGFFVRRAAVAFFSSAALENAPSMMDERP